MNVILLQDIKGLGKKGQIAKVSDGYARNLLIPKGMVKEATESNLREIERQKAAAAVKEAEELKTAEALAKQIAMLRVRLLTKGGEGGRLFGSITAKDIADGLEEQHQIHIDKRKIMLENPIKQTGEHIIEIRLYPEITAKLRVIVEV